MPGLSAAVLGMLAGLRPALVWLQSLLAWWVGELAALTPTRVRQAFGGRDNEVQVLASSDGLRVVGCGPQEFDLSDKPLPPALAAKLQGGAGAIVLVSPEMVLRRHVDLPIQVSAELHAAASFLVGHLTPFSAEQARHAVRAIARDRRRKILRAEIAVIPRATLDGWLQVLEALQVRVSAIFLSGDQGVPRLDFLAHGDEGRPRFPRRSEAWKPVLAIGLSVLIAGPLAIAYAIHTKAQALAAELVVASGSVREAQSLRAAVEARMSAAAFLPERLRGPSAVELVDELTKALPDGTWLFGLELKPGEATLAGFSPDVPGLLRRLQSAPFDAPELSSPVVHDAAAHRDRFEIKVHLDSAER